MSDKLDLSIVQSDNNVVRMGMGCSFLFLILFIIPYIQGFASGRLGLASLDSRKDFTISNVLEVSNRLLQIVVIYVFIACSMIYLAWQNFFVDDKRMIIPLSGYAFGLAMILILWVDRKSRPKMHYFLTIIVFVVGTIFNSAVYIAYRSFYDRKELLMLEFAAYGSLAIGAAVIIAVAVWHFVPRIGKLKMIDIVAGLELLHVSVLTITIFYISNLPPLPDELGNVVDFQGQTMKFTYAQPRKAII